MNKIKIKLNRDISGHKLGTTLTLIADSNGMPKERFWRNRIKESEIDNCVSVISNKKKLKES